MATNRIRACAWVVCIGLGAYPELAKAGPCYDFVTPAFESALDPAKVRRLFIVVEGSDANAAEVKEALADQVRRRGVTPITAEGAQSQVDASVRQAAERICREHDTQLVVTVRSLTGPTSTAAVEFIAPTGEVVGRSTVWKDGDPSCGHAGSGRDRAPVQAPSGHSWYGYQLALADVMALALLFTPESPATVLVYLVAPVAVHGANGQGGMGAASLGLRLVLPFVGMMIGAGSGSDNCTSDPCGLGGMVAGLGLGMLTAMLIDDLGLAWKPIYESQGTTGAPTSPAIPSAAVSMSAGLIPYRGGGGLGLVGRF